MNAFFLGLPTLLLTACRTPGLALVLACWISPIAGKLPDPKLYPSVPLAKIAAKDGWSRPRCLIAGTVTMKKLEDDGDHHFVVEEAGQRVICEIIPELPLTPPKVGDRVKVWGIPRWDGEHRWGEVHPVVGFLVESGVRAVEADTDPKPVEIDGQEKVDRLIKLEAKNVPAKAGVLWKVYPPIPPTDKADCPKGKFQAAPKPGVYTVSLILVSQAADGSLDMAEVEKVVTVGGGPAPTPGPGPAPSPVDPPTPQTGKLRVIFVAETNVAIPLSQQAILNSTAVRAFLKSKQIEARWYDPNEIVKEPAPWSDLLRAAVANGKVAPPLVAVYRDMNGGVFPLPANEAAALDLLKQYGGP